MSLLEQKHKLKKLSRKCAVGNESGCQCWILYCVEWLATHLRRHVCLYIIQHTRVVRFAVLLVAIGNTDQRPCLLGLTPSINCCNGLPVLVLGAVCEQQDQDIAWSRAGKDSC